MHESNADSQDFRRHSSKFELTIETFLESRADFCLMKVCIYIIYIYMYTYICIYIHKYVYIYVYIYTFV